MENTNLDKVIERIKKLLALAGNNPSENEAEAAMLKAQELMAEYGVSVDETSAEKIEYATVSCNHKWDMGFRKPLGHVISKNFKCEMFIMNGHISFIGHAADAHIAREVFEYAYEFALKEGNKHYNQAYAMSRPTKGVFNSYVKGFIVGIDKSFEAQSTALAIIVPPDVTEKYKEMTEGWKTSSGGMQLQSLNMDAYRAGLQDGKTVLNGRRLEG